MTDLLRGILDEAGEDGMAHREAVARKIVELAEGGYFPAIQFVFDRLEGRVRDRVDPADVEDPRRILLVPEIVMADPDTGKPMTLQ